MSSRRESALLLPGDASADPARMSPSQVSISTSSRSNGPRVKLLVEVAPRAGLHVYAPGVKDYRPVALKVAPQPGLTAAKPTFPKPETMFFEEANERVPVYGKPFTIEQDVMLDASHESELKAGHPITVSGALEYQACDDHICYKPVTVPIQWTVDAAATHAAPHSNQ